MSKNGARDKSPIGVVGLGLTGRGIAACLLANGFHVVACDRSEESRREVRGHIDAALGELARRRLTPAARASNWRKRFRIVAGPEEMTECGFAVESVNEDLPLKQDVFDRLESVLAPDAVIASNTSSLPISLLQRGRRQAERFIGMHWGEPAQITRYLEIIPGEQTSAATLERTRRLGEQCGKEPSVLNYDIRGFISNRLMYAMMREALYLLEAGVADAETIDRSFRNDIGWWSTLAGPFRWMDLTGLPAYAAVMEGLFPELANTSTVPQTMPRIAASGAAGVVNGRGFFEYSPEAARRWERAWVDFTYDIRKLVEKYERRLKS